MKLGKKDYKHDKRTIKLGDVLDADFAIPSVFNVDKGRRPFPKDNWGNDDHGDCVMATRANQLLRLERIETRRTVPVTRQEVIDKYFQLTGGADDGLVMLDTNRDWRTNGWDIPTKAATRHYTIDAFGELDSNNPKMLRQGVYLLHGIQLGLALPVSADAQFHNHETWDVVSGPDSQAGSWGGHAVYCLAYDHDSFTVLTWGRLQKITDAFINEYCDEAWAVVDSIDTWREAVDTEKLRKILKDIGASGIE